jgi:hypothetical protein
MFKHKKLQVQLLQIDLHFVFAVAIFLVMWSPSMNEL